MDKVVLGLFGTTLDAHQGTARWARWRPTVSMFEAPDLAIARLELWHPAAYTRQAEGLAADVVRLSPETVVRLHPLEIADPWDFEEVYGALHDLARAYPFRPDDEEYLVHITTGSHVAQICLFLLTESGHIPGKLLQTSPPVRRKPTPPAVIDLDLARYDRIAARFRAVEREGQGLLKSGIATRNPTFNRMIAQIEQVAGTTRAPILLVGPTGAGKSQLARQIVALKRARRLVTGPLVEVNCATLRGDTAMSALFGHARGAYTGADRARGGLLLAANGGTLFLDEVGELGLDEQAMLLRAIEDKRFLPVGSDKEVGSDFQLVAGTNRGLQDAVRAGRFREDLLARINLWTWRLPGLAERPEDIEPNLDFELERWRESTGQQLRFNREARARFVAFATSPEGTWPANFRDLNAAITRMATLAPGGRIDLPTVEDELARLRAQWGTPERPPPTAAPETGHLDGDAARRTAGPGRAEDQPPSGSAPSGPAPSGPAPSGSAPAGSPPPDAGARVRALLGDRAIDRFDLAQLEDVLAVCATARSLSDAGRRLYAVSRTERTSVNDADRLRKYLARWGLDWERITSQEW